MANGENKIGIVMGSQSDWPVMQLAVESCAIFQLTCETRIISAHRTTLDMVEYARQASKRGLRVIIAGAGGSAHLPGMIASLTPLPVIGVPIETQALKGMDSLLSIVQMPKGVPVATVAINGSYNAGLLAAEIIAVADPELQGKVLAYKEEIAQESRDQNKSLDGS